MRPVQLMHLVQERLAMYDPSDHSHRDRDAIASLWKEVAAVVNNAGRKFIAPWVSPFVFNLNPFYVELIYEVRKHFP